MRIHAHFGAMTATNPAFGVLTLSHHHGMGRMATTGQYDNEAACYGQDKGRQGQGVGYVDKALCAMDIVLLGL